MNLSEVVQAGVPAVPLCPGHRHCPSVMAEGWWGQGMDSRGVRTPASTQQLPTRLHTQDNVS